MNQPSARSASGSAESRLVLASRSPRRRRILSELGIEFELVAPEVEELTTGEPEALVLENARRKARAGRDLVAGEAMILGVDTDVALDGGLLGKAEDERGARERLEALSGRTHEVLSGLVLMTDAVVHGAPVERAGVAVTEVTFRKLDEPTIGLYLRSGEWRDRAGAYAIQGLGSILVESLRGDFSNVVGLPVALLLQLAPNLLRLRPKH
jgi:septum formation protein